MCATRFVEEGSVNITSTFNNFKSWSQLSDESKGGYLTGNIYVPLGVKKIELALYEKKGTPNPSLLFLTPYTRRSGEKPKPIQDKDYKVTFEIDDFGDLVIKPLNYWPKKPCKELISSKVWDKKSRKINLGGPEGLRLSILKPNERSNVKNKNILLENMMKVRNIPIGNPVDLSKVTLGVKFDDKDIYVKYSKVILDKSRFLITPTECSTRTICTQGTYFFTYYLGEVLRTSVNW